MVYVLGFRGYCLMFKVFGLGFTIDVPYSFILIDNHCAG